MTNPISAPASAHRHLQLLRAYFDAIEQNAPEDVLSGFFTPDLQQHEFPNRLVEKGAARGLPEVLEGSRKGRSVVQNQRYVMTNALVDGDRVAVELTWKAELKVPLGKLQMGDTMSATCGVFFHIRDGRIARQHNFDCFEPF